MSFITNMMFWLNSALETIVSAIGISIIVFVISLVGIGYGVGRAWNAKWKISSIGVLISLPLSLIAAIFSMVYVGMGFVSETYSRINIAKETQSIQDSMAKPSLIKKAFTAGLKQIRDKGNDVDPDELDKAEDTGLTIPGNTREAKEANTKLFVDGVMSVINNGVVPANKKGKKTEPGLMDVPPFSYGFSIINKPTESIIANITKEINECGLEGMPMTLDNTTWYECIMKPVVQANISEFEKKICKGIDGGRSSVLVMLIAILLIQTGLISWLAFIDIKPRKI